MNGPAHFAEAERLLALAASHPADKDTLIAKAQVHATLALVAIQANDTILDYTGRPEGREWAGAIG